ncbi:hypothetical protein COLO4_05921 [Corchorus olitorius]|uniref:RNase H type-1 domain-containing protein n=1 Tax=Corchorus olitorius TaxID=93759 RepID=A0A1R3KPN6_9ROSI|nr:hypothetical protein COLO4_05921 [Corchorus olitorius]
MWYPPPTNCLKFNVDGSAKASTGHAGCSGVLRDENGDMRAIFTAPLGTLNSNGAELMAIKMALEVFIKAGWKGKYSFIVESDSTMAVKWVQDNACRPWLLWTTFAVIDDLSKRLEE